MDGRGSGSDKPPPIPTAPDGPGRSYGSPAYGGYGGYTGYGGAPPVYGYGWQGPPLPTGKSIAAMVVGIVSVVLIATCWGSFLSVFSSVVALCLGVSARRGVARGELGGRGQATAGFVLGIVGLALSVIVSVLLVIGLADSANDTENSPDGDDSYYNARSASVALSLSA